MAFIPPPPAETLTIAGLEIRWYGICLAVAMVGGMELMIRSLRKRGFAPDDAWITVLPAVIAAVVGARFWHVITHAGYYIDHPHLVLKSGMGGFGVFGGIIAGVTTAALVARIRNVNLLTLADAVAAPLLLMIGVLRIGNWFNQELYGSATSLPWALEVAVDGTTTTHHPLFLYEILICIAIALGLFMAERYTTIFRPGMTLPAATLCYSFWRLLAEPLRVTQAPKLLGIPSNQWGSLVVIGLSIAAIIYLRRRSCTPSSFDDDQYAA